MPDAWAIGHEPSWLVGAVPVAPETTVTHRLPRPTSAHRGMRLNGAMQARSDRTSTLEELRAGDVLLSQGRGWLSRLMAWNAECPYSHAALVLGDGTLIEAMPPRVRRRPVTAMFAPRCQPRLVDVWRPVNRDGSELSDAQRTRIASAAVRWLGWPFAGLKMAWLAVQTLLRHKLRVRRWSLPAPRHDRGLSCTEYVCRVLHEAIGFAPARPALGAPGASCGAITLDLCASRSLRPRGRLLPNGCLRG